MHRYRVSCWRTGEAAQRGDPPAAVFTDVPGWSRHDAKTNLGPCYEEQYGPWWDAEKTHDDSEPKEEGGKMTYEQWAAAKSTEPLLAFAKTTLKPKVYRRRLRLAACWKGMFLWRTDRGRMELCRLGIDRAYGKMLPGERQKVEMAFFQARKGIDSRVYGGDASAVALVRNTQGAWFEQGLISFDRHCSPNGYPDIVRDVIPFPLDDLDVQYDWLIWQDGLVQKVAEVIVEEEKWDETYALADALEEAGCQHEPLLAHLREKKGHSIGCWALDLLLTRL